MASREEDTLRVGFSNTMKLALQQRESRLWTTGTVFTGPIGELGGAFNESPMAAPVQFVSDLYEPVRVSPMTSIRRWLVPKIYRSPDPKVWSTLEQAWELYDPQSIAIQGFVSAVNRFKDRLFIDTMFGASRRGATAPGGDADVAFDVTNQTVAVTIGNGGSGDVGMNPEKITAAFTKLVGAEADENEQKFCAIGAEQLRDLLWSTKTTDANYILGSFSREGRVNFLNIEFINYQGLPTTSAASGVRSCPMWIKGAMYTADIVPTQEHVDNRPDLGGNPIVAYVDGTIAAARTNEKAVVNILCKEV